MSPQTSVFFRASDVWIAPVVAYTAWNLFVGVPHVVVVDPLVGWIEWEHDISLALQMLPPFIVIQPPDDMEPPASGKYVPVWRCDDVAASVIPYPASVVGVLVIVDHACVCDASA